jgi:hypothetical protein
MSSVLGSNDGCWAQDLGHSSMFDCGKKQSELTMLRRLLRVEFMQSDLFLSLVIKCRPSSAAMVNRALVAMWTPAERLFSTLTTCAWCVLRNFFSKTGVTESFGWALST